jgi:hypothetical protein
MRNQLSRLVVVLLLLCGLAASCTAPDDPSLPHYDIRLFRTVAVGDHVTVMLKVDCDIRMATISGGPPTPGVDGVINASITAEETVQATSADGHSLKTSFLIMASNQTIGSSTHASKTSEIVPVGTEIIVEKSENEPVKLTVAGGEPSPDVKMMLLPLLISESDQGASDDAFFGTRQPRKVGDAWPVDAAAGAAGASIEEAAIAKLPTLIDPASITGTATLAEVNAGAMKVVSDITVDLTHLPQKPGLSIKNGSYRCRFTDTVPLDATKHIISSVLSLDCHMEGTLTSSSQVVDMRMTRLAVYLPD